MTGGNGGGFAGASGTTGRAGGGGATAGTGGASAGAGGSTAATGGAGAGAGAGGGGGIAGTGDARKVLGESCAESIDCVSGHCVHGACCESACNEANCVSCVLPGSVGFCRPMDVGSVCGPPSECLADGVTGVGTAVCDGKGVCRPRVVFKCAPYTCNPSTGFCRATCTSDADCAAGRACVNGSCGVTTSGASCQKDSECASGFCSDGVCCSSRCDSACTSCALPGQVGSCWPVPEDALDPHSFCKDQGAASCGTNSRCDGRGNCQKYAPGTTCSAPRCVGSTLTLKGVCYAPGICSAPAQSCAPGTCRPDQTGCQAPACDDSICPAKFYCVSADTCAAKKALGAACASTRECLSGVCAGGLDGGPGFCTLLLL